MINFFDINNVFFTVFSYPMSYLEFFGTLLNLWSVWLVTRSKILTWPVGIVAVILFMVLFYQIQLYSDFFEMIYFLVTGFYGWWVWSRYSKKQNSKKGKGLISFSSLKTRLIYAGFIGLGTLAMGEFMSNIHIYFPKFFGVAASFPYLDAFTTVMSFSAMILMSHKKLESWILWITVDIIGIWLYFVKDVKFLSLLYLIFLFLATKGLINWYIIWKKEKKNQQPSKSVRQLQQD